MSSKSPFVGLAPYDASSRRYFCGRERETDLIAANACVARLSIFYGPSGTGKSSVLGAGLIPGLLEPSPTEGKDRTALLLAGPDGPVPVFWREWTGDVWKGLRLAIAEALRPWKQFAGLRFPQAWLGSEASPATTARPPALILILDQFEDLFVQNPELARTSAADLLKLAAQFSRGDPADPTDTPGRLLAAAMIALMNTRLCAVNVVLSLREDCLASLDVFKGLVPDLFATLIRLDPLDEKAVRAVLETSLERWSEDHRAAFTMQPELVEALLADPTLRIREPGRPVGTSARFEVLFLQFVLEQLWQQDMIAPGLEAKGGQLTNDTFKKLQGAEGIRRRFVDGTLSKCLPDPTRLRWFLEASRVLVSRTQKFPWVAAELARTIEAPLRQAGIKPPSGEEMAGLLRTFARERLVREMPFSDKTEAWDGQFEVTHDVLASDLYRWRVQQDAVLIQQQERAQMIRRLSWTSVAVLIAALVLLAIFYKDAVRQRKNADKSAHAERARAEAFRAVVLALQVDPEASLFLASRSLAEAPSAEGTDAARRALFSSLVRRRLDAFPYPDKVVRAAFNPQDPTQILAVGYGGRILLWNTQDNRTLPFPPEPDAPGAVRHTDKVMDVAFNPAGTIAATASFDQSVLFWDARTGRPLFRKLPHPGAVRSVQFNHAGDHVVTACEDGLIRLWGLGDGQPPKILPPPWENERPMALYAAFCPQPGDGRIVSSYQDGTVSLCDLDQNGQYDKARSFRPMFPQRVNCVVFSPDGNLLATAEDDMTAKIYDLQHLDAGPKVLRGHTGTVFRVSFSPDGRQVLTASLDGTARLWDVQTGDELTVLRGHTDAVNGAAFDASGQRIVTASADRSIRVWDSLTSTDDWTPFFAHNGGVTSLKSVAGGNILTAGRDGMARLWDQRWSQQWAKAHLVNVETTAGKLEPTLYGVHAADMDPTGQLLITAADDGLTRIWNLSKPTQPAQIITSDPNDAASAVAFSPDGQKFAVASTSGRIEIRARDLSPLTLLDAGQKNKVYRVAFNSDGTRLLAACDDSVVRIWTVADGHLEATLRGHQREVTCAAFNPKNDHQIVSGSGDRTVRLWDVTTNKEIKRMEAHTSSVRDVAFDADGEKILSVSYDHTACVWQPGHGKDDGTVKVLRGYSSGLTAGCFEPTGSRVIVAGTSGLVWVDDPSANAPEIARVVRSRIVSPPSELHDLLVAP